ncbi:MAG: LysR family transcriptional regulator [Candidatus Dormibacteraeota bacterium]|nr:LysR family transcriptional regulator [Candidatus Dormibacteraeota bacterium]
MKTNFWRRLELRHLVVLHAVAEARTLWAASEALECTPSAVSQQLSALERIAGQTLVERHRGRRQVSLTPAGAMLLRHADAVVARLRAAEADFAALQEGAAGTLRLGTYQSIGVKMVPRLLAEFAAEWPGVEVQLVEGVDDSTLLNMVERGELDLTFATLPLTAGPFGWARMMSDPFVLALSSRSALQPPLGAAELEGLKLVSNQACQDQVAGYLRGLGVRPRFAFSSTDNGVVHGLVAAQMGAAIAPRLTFDDRDPDVKLYPVGGFPARIIVVAWHRDRLRSTAAPALVARAEAVCAELERSQVTHPFAGG